MEVESLGIPPPQVPERVGPGDDRLRPERLLFRGAPAPHFGRNHTGEIGLHRQAIDHGHAGARAQRGDRAAVGPPIHLHQRIRIGRRDDQHLGPRAAGAARRADDHAAAAGHHPPLLTGGDLGQPRARRVADAEPRRTRDRGGLGIDRQADPDRQLRRLLRGLDPGGWFGQRRGPRRWPRGRTTGHPDGGGRGQRRDRASPTDQSMPARAEVSRGSCQT